MYSAHLVVILLHFGFSDPDHHRNRSGFRFHLNLWLHLLNTAEDTVSTPHDTITLAQNMLQTLYIHCTETVPHHSKMPHLIKHTNYSVTDR